MSVVFGFFRKLSYIIIIYAVTFSIELFHISTWWDWHGISGSYKYKSRYHMSFHFDSQKSVTFSCVVLIWFLLMFLSCRDLDADIITFFDLCFFNVYWTNFISGIKSAIPHSNLTLYKKYSKKIPYPSISHDSTNSSSVNHYSTNLFI